MSGENWNYSDLTAEPNERHWRVSGGKDGGVKVEALDEEMGIFDAVTLRRFGAFIVVDQPVQRRVPDGFEFLADVVALRTRASAVGMQTEMPPVLVHSSRIRYLFELGYLPGVDPPGRTGTMGVFGITVVWSEDLDEFAPLG